MTAQTPPASRRTIAGRSIRWDAARAEAAYAEGWWVRETLADTLAREAAADGERVLVREGTRTLTASGLLERARGLAQALLARFEPGSAVTFMLPNWLESAEIYLGATLAGMVVNPVLPSLRDHDLKFILGDVGARMIFVPAHFRKCDYVEMLSRVQADMGEAAPQVVVLRGEPGPHTAFEDLFAPVADPVPLPVIEPDAVRMIMYTSGTTGSPKGVMHTHNSIHALIRQLGRHWLVERGDRWLVPSPISHIGGSIYAFEMPLLLGTTAVLMEAWDATEALAIFSGEKITHMAGATPFLEQLLAATRAADTHLPDLKVFICGGASVPPHLVTDALSWFENACVSRVYGSTEVPVTTVGTIDRGDALHASQTDGRPGIAEVVLGEAEEIRAKGPQMLAGYVHADQEDTAFDAAGFYRTGDQGTWIDGDFLVVSGRLKDIIIRNGENIAPKEIEDLLVRMPGIAEVAIVGLPNERTGERACAVIVPDAEGEGPDVKAVFAFLDDLGVARFKIPEQVEHWTSLPRNDAGKVVKHSIRSALLGD